MVAIPTAPASVSSGSDNFSLLMRRGTNDNENVEAALRQLSRIRHPGHNTRVETLNEVAKVYERHVKLVQDGKMHIDDATGVLSKARETANLVISRIQKKSGVKLDLPKAFLE